LVTIEQHAALSGRIAVPRLPGWIAIAMLAALAGGAGLAARGFTESGWRLGSELVWRFTCFVFFAASIAGPLARLIPWQPLREACENRCQLVWGFCASFTLYLAGLRMADFAAYGSRAGVMAGVGLFDLAGAVLIIIIACTASRRVEFFLDESMRRILLGAGLCCFWLAYALTGLEHISGPHRPDAFYGVSILLMIAALLLRFADDFAANIFRRRNPA
jgi:hypothetical protein